MAPEDGVVDDDDWGPVDDEDDSLATTDLDTERDDGDSLHVTLPSGADFWVLTENERRFVVDRVRKYGDELMFTNVSDLQDLDTVVQIELFKQRWGVWLSTGEDYNQNPVDESDLMKHIKEWSNELRQIKSKLMIDRITREKTSGEGSVAAYIASLLQRAKAFCVHRNNQAAKAIELQNQLIGMITFFRNSDEDERIEFHHTADDIFEWIWDVMRPEFEQIDADFKSGNQTYWIREQ